MEEGPRRTLIGVDRETLVLRNYSRSRLLGLDKPTSGRAARSPASRRATPSP